MNDVSPPSPPSRPTVTEADLSLIQKVIPHRYPFLFIDRVKDIVPGVSAVGVKNVTFNEPHFQGHFPGLPLMPGVTIIESMAQTAGVLVGLTLGLQGKGALVYFMTIESGKFREKVVPGDVLELHVKVLRGGSRVWKFEGRGMVAGKLAAEAVFMAQIDHRKD
jgi:3-hydroxyacyl-[acyl-carrier-protein] dehydratase